MVSVESKGLTKVKFFVCYANLANKAESESESRTQKGSNNRFPIGLPLFVEANQKLATPSKWVNKQEVKPV